VRPRSARSFTTTPNGRSARRKHRRHVKPRFEAGEAQLFSLPGMRDAFVALVRLAAAVGLDGYIDDSIADVLGWGFELADVNVPVSSWSGEQDEIVLGHHA
jgi:hypothetical protein